MRFPNIRSNLAVASFVASVGLPVALALFGPGPTRLDEKIAALKADASPGARMLLKRDRYADYFFTDPAEILNSDPRGDIRDDSGNFPVNFPAPAPADAVPCGEIARAGLAVVLIAGQSNAQNSTKNDDLYRPRHKFYNFNVEDGRCYIAREQALGTTGFGSAFALPLGDEMIDRGLAANVLIVPIAIGGTYIEEWRPHGRYFSRFEKAIVDLASYQIAPTLVLWQHGEGNAGPLMTDQTFGLFGDSRDHRALTVTPELRDAARANYEMRFYEMASGLRDLGVTAPIFASVSTVCGYPRSEPSIRAAQQALPDRTWSIYEGPDTDEIGPDGRSDGCHFNTSGIQKAADKWSEIIAAYMKRPSAAQAAIMPTRP